MSERSNTMVNIGDAALTGWRGAAGRAIAKPVAKHSRFTQAQVEAFIGLGLLVVRGVPDGATPDRRLATMSPPSPPSNEAARRVYRPRSWRR